VILRARDERLVRRKQGGLGGRSLREHLSLCGIYAHACLCVCVYVCMYVCMCMPVRVYVCMYECMRMPVCMYVCMHACASVFVYSLCLHHQVCSTLDSPCPLQSTAVVAHASALAPVNGADKSLLGQVRLPHNIVGCLESHFWKLLSQRSYTPRPEVIQARMDVEGHDSVTEICDP